jgi:hypothetical protein
MRTGYLTLRSNLHFLPTHLPYVLSFEGRNSLTELPPQDGFYGRVTRLARHVKLR